MFLQEIWNLPSELDFVPAGAFPSSTVVLNVVFWNSNCIRGPNGKSTQRRTTMHHNNNNKHFDVTVWQISMLILCIYVILAMIAQEFFILPEQISIALDRFDFAICMLFLADFFFQFYTAENKLAYMKWGWIDLISSIPNIQFLRWGRMFRIIRILRILRGVRSTRLIFQIMFTKRNHGTFASVVVTCFILVIFSTIAILICEKAPNSNIKTAGDALWWAYTTISTVGYGDYYPMTFEGRIIAAILITAGMALFGTFTAYVASWFFTATGEKEMEIDEKALEEIQNLKTKLDNIEKKIDETNQSSKK
jgi:voltage-gated potassium channel